MSVKILTEINPHADGVHCGRCNKIEFYTYCAEFQESLELDNELCMLLCCAKCLAAQKEAENLTAIARAYFAMTSKPVDRIEPVPQTIEQELKKYDSLERQ